MATRERAGRGRFEQTRRLHGASTPLFAGAVGNHSVSTLNTHNTIDTLTNDDAIRSNVAVYLQDDSRQDGADAAQRGAHDDLPQAAPEDGQPQVHAAAAPAIIAGKARQAVISGVHLTRALLAALARLDVYRHFGCATLVRAVLHNCLGEMSRSVAPGRQLLPGEESTLHDGCA